MSEPIAALVLGFVGSAHCIGMCGGFAAAIGATGQPFVSLAARQVVYSLGRITTYAFLGACGGSAGLYLSQFDSVLITAQQVFSIVAGIIMLLFGLSVLRAVRPDKKRPGVLTDLLAPLFQHFLNARGWSGFLLAGVGNGFLPCGLVYACLAQAVATGSMIRGALIMAMFGAGTVPAMFLVGCGSTFISHTARLRVYRLAACFVIIAGVLSVTRAFSVKDGDHCHDPHAASTRPISPSDRSG